MTGPRIGLATCAEYPQLDEDDRLLLPALAARDAEGVPAVWDDPDVRWDRFDAVLIRSTWDYVDAPDRFRAWLDDVADATTLLNPGPLVRWSMDKAYLGALAGAGIPTVPTRYVQPGGTIHVPTGGRFVVKPTVSAGSRDTAVYDGAAEGMAAVGHVQRLLDSGRTAMLQPYVDSVDEHGETALLFIGGRFSHAIRKGPLLRPGAAPTDGLFAPEQIDPRTATDAERAVADAVLAAVPSSLGTPTYARVDLLRGDAGPVLLELELFEPSLFLRHDGDAAGRLADAVLAAVTDV